MQHQHRPGIARIICLIATLHTFLLLPALHVLVHEREAAQLARAQRLHAMRVLHRASLPHTDHGPAAHEHDDGAPVPHQHSNADGASHGRNAPDHLAVALALSVQLPLPPPPVLHEQLAASCLIDRLHAHPRIRSHSTRAPPLS